MSEKYIMPMAEVNNRAMKVVKLLYRGLLNHIATVRVYGVPRGGVSAAMAMAMQCESMIVVDSPDNADIIVDDIVDSGATSLRFAESHPNLPFFALVNKKDHAEPLKDVWVQFPWEAADESGVDANITRLLQWLGEDPTRGGLLETPARVAKAWKFWCSGYGQDPAEVIKCFEDGAEAVDEMVVRKGIPIYSHCEHHMAAIIGEATVAYIPNGKVVGLSKLDRVVNIFARRLQVQERLTNQIADCLHEHLEARGVAVHISARHMCVESRGVQHSNSMTTTSALRGVFKEQPETRAEFMMLLR